MKLLVFIFFAFCIKVSAKTYGQKVNLNIKNAEIQSALKEIRKQTGYLFFFKNEDLRKTERVSIIAVNEDLKTVLDEILSHTALTYQIIDKTIILKKSSLIDQLFHEKEVALDISGTVTDQNGKPLAGATVVLQGSGVGTSTDLNGNFTLRNVNPGATLIVSYIGFTPKTVQVQNQSRINIALELAVNKL